MADLGRAFDVGGHDGLDAPTIRREALLDLVANLTDQAVLLLDRDGYVRTWNLGAENLKGYTEEEAVGLHFSSFYPPEAQAVDHPTRELEIAAAMGRFEEEGWRVRRDGTRFFAHVVITAIHSSEGELLGYGKTTRDLTLRKQAEEQQANTLRLLEATARTDALTGLPNRRAWDEVLAQEMARAKRMGTPLAVSVIDVDHFKEINDARGHDAGDRFLKRAAVRWRQALRRTDVLSRWGGEEFAVCLPDCALDEAVRVIDALRAATPDEWTCSAGVALWDRQESASVFLRRADRGMYTAKEQGRDTTVALGQLGPA